MQGNEMQLTASVGEQRFWRMAPIGTGLYGLDSGQDRSLRTALEKLANLTV